MRVIAGIAKGMKLVAPASGRVRPALDQVKEAIFNILFDVRGAAVLDCFAGCGSIGIEALSRGATSAVFVERWGPAAESIRRNLEHTRLAENARVLLMPVARAIPALAREGARFDLLFVDPPYEQGLVNPTLAALAASDLIADEARIVVEHHPKEPAEAPPGLSLTETRKYGQTRISFLNRS